MPQWHAEVEIPIDLTREQLEQHAEGTQTAHYNEAERILRLGTWLNAADFDAATAAARKWVKGLSAAQAAEPQRLTVDSEAAQTATWAVGAHVAAERLGLSKARMLTLEKSDPAFPGSVPGLDVGSTKVFRADEIDDYGRTRERGKPGRPRKANPEA